MGRDGVSVGAVVIHQHVLKSTTGVMGCEQENGWSVWFIRLVRQAGKADKLPFPGSGASNCLSSRC